MVYKIKIVSAIGLCVFFLPVLANGRKHVIALAGPESLRIDLLGQKLGERSGLPIINIPHLAHDNQLRRSTHSGKKQISKLMNPAGYPGSSITMPDLAHWIYYHTSSRFVIVTNLVTHGDFEILKRVAEVHLAYLSTPNSGQNNTVKQKHAAPRTSLRYLLTRGLGDRYLDADFIVDATRSNIDLLQDLTLRIETIRSDFIHCLGPRILLVGEGNGSFSESLAQRLSTERQRKDFEITATERDENRLRVSSYKNKNVNLTVVGGVDATDLASFYLDQKFDSIGWQFPHNGDDPEKAVFTMNKLFSKFFRSAHSVLAPHGKIFVSFKNGGHYDRIFMTEMARWNGLKLSETFDFPFEKFPEYRFETTNPNQRVFFPNGATTYIFSSKAQD